MNSDLKHTLASFMIAGVLSFSVQVSATDMSPHNLFITLTIETAPHMENDAQSNLSCFMDTQQYQNIRETDHLSLSYNPGRRTPRHTTLIDDFACTCPFCHMIRISMNDLPGTDAEIPNDDQVLSTLDTINSDAIFHHTNSSFGISPIIMNKRNFKIVLKQ
jgi:hypothetical protein